jgi:hypothetical protein
MGLEIGAWQFTLFGQEGAEYNCGHVECEQQASVHDRWNSALSSSPSNQTVELAGLLLRTSVAMLRKTQHSIFARA